MGIRRSQVDKIKAAVRERNQFRAGSAEWNKLQDTAHRVRINATDEEREQAAIEIHRELNN